MKKQFTGMLLTLTLLISLLPSVAMGSSTFDFVDVQPDDWYYNAVQTVWKAGLMSGTSETTFEPNTNFTRAMTVQILYKAAGSPAVNTAAAFSDVAADAWYAKAVNWAAENSLTLNSSGWFGPNDSIPREEFATLLHRYAQLQEMDTSASTSLGTYSDSVQISSYALDAMSWAVGEGVISGTSRTTLSPSGLVTRAQAASMLMRFFDL